MTMKKKWVGLVSAGLIAGLVLSACGQNGSGTAAKEVKIGQLHPLSGAFALEGKQLEFGVRLAVDEVNQAGGIKSLGGAKVTIVDADSEGKPEKGVSETQRLIREGVVGILGTYQSAVTLAATQEAEKQKTPFVITVSTADNIMSRGFKYVFRLQPNASTMAKNFLEYLKQLNGDRQSNIRTIVTVHEDSVFGSGIAKYIQEHAQEYGFQVVADVPYSAKATDLNSEISKVKAANADVVAVTSYLRDGTLLLSGLNQAGVKPKAIIGVANGAISNHEFIVQNKNWNQYLMDVNYRENVRSSKVQQIKEAYKSKYNMDMSPDAVYAYTATKVLLDAIERAGSTDKDKIREALANTHFTDHILPQGAIEFDNKGENTGARAVLSQIIDGTSKVVLPTDYAQAQPVFPFPWK